MGSMQPNLPSPPPPPPKQEKTPPQTLASQALEQPAPASPATRGQPTSLLELGANVGGASPAAPALRGNRKRVRRIEQPGPFAWNQSRDAGKADAPQAGLGMTDGSRRPTAPRSQGEPKPRRLSALEQGLEAYRKSRQDMLDRSGGKRPAPAPLGTVPRTLEPGQNVPLDRMPAVGAPTPLGRMPGGGAAGPMPGIQRVSQPTNELGEAPTQGNGRTSVPTFATEDVAANPERGRKNDAGSEATGHVGASRPANLGPEDAEKEPERIPTLTVGADRKHSIISDTPSRFAIQPNPEADPSVPFYAIKAASEVHKYDALIEEEAKRAGIDPDEVRAIVHLETTQGWYDRAAAVFGRQKSIRPMNVNAEYWEDLGFSREDLSDPRTNIRAGIVLLQRIAARMPGRPFREVATMYNNLSADAVTDYGARAEQILRQREWD